jgi:hypothetical protein
MIDLPQSTVCPFAELLDRRILGDFTAEDSARLEEHLKQGCSSCSERWKSEARLEASIEGAMAPIARDVERRKPFVLDRLKDRLAREDELRRGRRRRRVGLNAALLLILLLGMSLLAATYLAYFPMRRKLFLAQRGAADTEIRAMLVGLSKLVEQRGKSALPNDRSELALVLGQRRTDIARPYFSPNVVGAEDGTELILDPWKHPYVFKRTPGQVRIYSLGPNGVDEDGGGTNFGMALELK